MNLQDRLQKLGEFFTTGGKIDFLQVAIHLEIPKEISLVYKEELELQSEFKEKLKDLNNKKRAIQDKCKHPITKSFYGAYEHTENCEICGKEI